MQGRGAMLVPGTRPSDRTVLDFLQAPSLIAQLTTKPKRLLQHTTKRIGYSIGSPVAALTSTSNPLQHPLCTAWQTHRLPVLSAAALPSGNGNDSRRRHDVRAALSEKAVHSNFSIISVILHVRKTRSNGQEILQTRNM